jgi:hypothetical protein
MTTTQLARGLQSSRGFVLPKITPYVQCDACRYVWAYVVSPHFCPHCCHEHFSNAYDPVRDPERALAYDMVFLADNEWGNTIMREIAGEWFRDHPDCNFVWVYEHAGWSLVYHRSGQIVGTANDAAIMNPNRPKPTHGSTIVYRRQRKSDRHEVTTLADYQPQSQDAIPQLQTV